MAGGGTEYTVFGYGSGFDSRPTVFVNAFPPTRVCSVCGLVPSTAGFLPCRHVLCHGCYDRSIKEEISQCPLGTEVYQRGDVVWSTFSKDNILDRKIHCWNARFGCAAVGPASEMLEHISDDCQYHAVTCQRCSHTVAQKDVFDHVMSADCAQEEPQTAPTFDGAGVVNLLDSLQSLDNRFTESTRLSLDAIKEIQDKQTSFERNLSCAVRQCFREEIGGIFGQLELKVRCLCRENTERVLASFENSRTATNALKTAYLDGNKDTGKALKELTKSIHRRSGIEEQLLRIRKEFEDKLNTAVAATKATLGDKMNSSEPLEWTIDTPGASVAA